MARTVRSYLFEIEINYDLVITEPVEDGPSARLVGLRVVRVDGADKREERPRGGVPPVHDARLLLLVLDPGEGAGRGQLGRLLGLPANICEGVDWVA